MTAPAPVTTTDDVARRLGRELTEPETALAYVLAGDAERILASRTSDHTLDALDPALVAQVAASAVVRVLRNPDGFRSESAGGVSYTIDTRAAAGFLTILADEWALLGLIAPSSNGGAFSFGPSLGPARPGPVPTSWA